MPLWRAHKKTKRNLKRVISHNIHVERKAGRPQKQAVAIAIRAANSRKRNR